MVEASVTNKKSRKGSNSFIFNHGIGSFSIEQLGPKKILTLSGLEV